jgi:hypothetical protein
MPATAELIEEINLRTAEHKRIAAIARVNDIITHEMSWR